MCGRKAVIRALKDMSKPFEWGNPAAVEGYIESMWSENDRGVIILQGGIVEQLLEDALKAKMPHLNTDERDKLFGYNAPITTFSNKMRVANAMGLVSRQMMGKIDLFREMRNACAHSREPISFQSDQIFNAVVCLVSDMRIGIPRKDDHEGIKMAFLLMGLLIMGTVVTGSVNEGHNRLVKYLNEHPTSHGIPAQ